MCPLVKSEYFGIELLSLFPSEIDRRFVIISPEARRALLYYMKVAKWCQLYSPDPTLAGNMESATHLLGSHQRRLWGRFLCFKCHWSWLVLAMSIDNVKKKNENDSDGGSPKSRQALGQQLEGPVADHLK